MAAYNPQDLVDYLTGPRWEDPEEVPSFSNIDSELLAGMGDVFGVGTPRPAAAVNTWRNVKEEQDASLTMEEKTSAEYGDAYIGLPVNQVLHNKMLEKSRIEAERTQMLAGAGDTYQPHIETIGRSLEVLHIAAQRDPERYGPRVQLMRQSLADTLTLQQQEIDSIKTNPAYVNLVAQETELAGFIEANKSVAAKELELQAAKERANNTLEMGTEAERKDKLEKISPVRAGVAEQVLGLPDQATAKEQLAFRGGDLDPVALQVVDDITKNISTPHVNTPIMNMGKSAEEWGYYKNWYMNSFPAGDAEGKRTAQVLLSEMDAAKVHLDKELNMYLGSGDTSQLQYMKSLQKEVEALSKLGEAQREAQNYSAKIWELEQIKQEESAAFVQQRTVQHFKKVLVNINQDLLTTPMTISPNLRPIADRFVSEIKASEKVDIAAAIQDFYTRDIKNLVASGYSQASIDNVVDTVLDGYMRSINDRHALSGILLTPADLPEHETVYQKLNRVATHLAP